MNMALERNMNRLMTLRKNIVYQNPFSILLANFEGSLQQKDIEKRTALMQNFFRIKIDCKFFDDTERNKKGLSSFDFDNIDTALDILRNEFDMPFWGHYVMNDGHIDSLEGVKEYNNKFIYQLKGCNLCCPYCYVDDLSKNGKPGQGSRFFTIPEIIDIFLEERKKAENTNRPLNSFRPSGGEPTIAVEQWLYVLDEFKKRGLDKEIYVQGDTNLTTGHFIKLLEENGEIKRGLLKEVGKYKNFGLLCSFKGTDENNYHENTDIPLKECAGFLEENIYTFKKLMKAGIDSYPFFYNPNPATIESFLYRLADEMNDKQFIRRSWVFVLKPYGPEKERLRKRLRKEGMKDENKIESKVDDYCQGLGTNFLKAKEVMQKIYKKEFNENYQEYMRPGIKLRVNK
jgi:organic radical activating enzyme